jgi:hypothetical protein
LKLPFRLLPVFVLSLAIASNARSLTLTFDELASVSASSSTNIGNIYSGNGFSIAGTMSQSWSGSGFHAIQESSPLWTGSPGLAYFGVGAQLELVRTDGTPFGLNSIDISRGDSNTGLIPVTFTGVKLDGSKVFQSYWFQENWIGRHETFLFDGQFKELSALSWQQGAEWHQFDNIVISSVPEPTTAALLFSGLMLLASNRRRRHSKA